MTPGTIVATAAGKQLRLGPVLGKGGEGKIFHVDEDPRLAVKIYTDGKQLNRLSKIRAMLIDRLSTKTSFAAFPLAPVVVNGGFAGFVMRKALESKPLFNLCITSDRKTEFPEITYRFMVRVALNYSRAIASLHSIGVVVGDINESGALVSDKGLVTLIDADSFQYTSGNNVHRCFVGKPEYTPPELHGQNLANVVRTPEHDAFGLAVILFEILFLGRHPFQGIPRAGDHPTIAEAIAAGRFAYSPHKTITHLDPPRHMPVLTDIPNDVAMAFQRAFGPYLGSMPRTRPAAAEWVRLLETMEQDIVECKFNPAHHYSRSAATCPWCRLEAGYGTVLFVRHQAIVQSAFKLDVVMGRIDAISSPGPAPDLASVLPALFALSPSAGVKLMKRNMRIRQVAGVGMAVLAVFLMLSAGGWAFFLLLAAAFLFFSAKSGIDEVTRQKTEAERHWTAAQKAWNEQAGSERFDAKRANLRDTASSYRALPGVERDMLAALEKRKRELQMQKHLESCKLAHASIDGIGYGRKLTLRSLGIETAWDIKRHKVLAIVGFGPALTGKLMDWRRSMEQRFKFNPSVPTDPAEIANVRTEIAMRRHAIEAELLKGVTELETVKAETIARRGRPDLHENAYHAYRQAEEDLRYLS